MKPRTDNVVIRPPKKKRSKDGTYNPSSDPSRKRKAGLTDPNVVAMRSSKDTHFVDQNGQLIELKFCPVYDSGVVIRNNYDAREFKENIEPLLKKIPAYRPLQKITEVSDTGSPLKGETPQGSKVRAVLRTKAFTILSNDTRMVAVDEQDIITTIPNSSAFFNSPFYQNLKKAEDDVKRQEALIDSKLLAQSSLAHQRAGKKRVTSQNRVAAKESLPEKEGRVDTYVKAAVIFSADNVSWEWLHLIAYKFWHAYAQRIGNIAAGTYSANTITAMIEQYIPFLAKKYPEGFQFVATADMVTSEDGKHKTHIASTIDYWIVTKDFKLSLELNAQDPNNPHYSFLGFFGALFQTLTGTSKAATPAACSPSLLTLPTFFTRPAPTPPSATPAPVLSAKKTLKF